MNPNGGAVPAASYTASGLKSCEAKLVSLIRNHWALDFGTREVRLTIEYQDKVPVLIRVTQNVVREEKLR